MMLFLYLDQDTWIHRLDPRAKIICTVFLFAISMCFNHPINMGAVSLGVFLLAIWARALRNIWKFRYLLLLLVAFSALLWPFFAEGPTPLWNWGPLQVSRESLFYGMGMGLRFATFVIIGLTFLSTTRNEELTNGLIRLGIPYSFAFAMSTALRLVPTFVGAGATIIEAQVSRGLDLEKGNIFKRAGKFIPQAVPLFIYAIRHANYMAMALESRGFDPGAKRTFYYEPRMCRLDYAVIIFSILLFALLLYMRLGLSLGIAIPGRL